MIGFDIDGVLCDFVHGFRQVAHHLNPQSKVYSTGGQLEWDVLADSDEEEDKIWRYIDTFPFWLNMSPLVTPGEIQQMTDHMKQREGILYVTSRKEKGYAIEQTVDWLAKHGFPNPDAVISARDKSPVIRSHGMRAFLDDNPRHLREIEGTEVWVRDWKYNRLVEFDHLPRVSSVGEWLRSI